MTAWNPYQGDLMVAQPQAFIPESEHVTIRRATSDDAAVCGKICFEAFSTLARRHNFPPDFPAPEIPVRVLSTMFSHPSFFLCGGRTRWENCRKQLSRREDFDCRSG